MVNSVPSLFPLACVKFTVGWFDLDCLNIIVWVLNLLYSCKEMFCFVFFNKKS